MSVIGLVGMSASDRATVSIFRVGSLAESCRLPETRSCFHNARRRHLPDLPYSTWLFKRTNKGGCRGYAVSRYPRCTAAVHDDGAGISRRRVRLVPGLGYEDQVRLLADALDRVGSIDGAARARVHRKQRRPLSQCRAYDARDPGRARHPARTGTAGPHSGKRLRPPHCRVLSCTTLGMSVGSSKATGMMAMSSTGAAVRCAWSEDAPTRAFYRITSTARYCLC